MDRQQDCTSIRMTFQLPRTPNAAQISPRLFIAFNDTATAWNILHACATFFSTSQLHPLISCRLDHWCLLSLGSYIQPSTFSPGCGIWNPCELFWAKWIVWSVLCVINCVCSLLLEDCVDIRTCNSRQRRPYFQPSPLKHCDLVFSPLTLLFTPSFCCELTALTATLTRLEDGVMNWPWFGNHSPPGTRPHSKVNKAPRRRCLIRGRVISLHITSDSSSFI